MIIGMQAMMTDINKSSYTFVISNDNDELKDLSACHL